MKGSRLTLLAFGGLVLAIGAYWIVGCGDVVINGHDSDEYFPLSNGNYWNYDCISYTMGESFDDPNDVRIVHREITRMQYITIYNNGGTTTTEVMSPVMESIYANNLAGEPLLFTKNADNSEIPIHKSVHFIAAGNPESENPYYTYFGEFFTDQSGESIWGLYFHDDSDDSKPFYIFGNTLRSGDTWDVIDPSNTDLTNPTVLTSLGTNGITGLPSDVDSRLLGGGDGVADLMDLSVVGTIGQTVALELEAGTFTAFPVYLDHIMTFHCSNAGDITYNTRMTFWVVPNVGIVQERWWENTTENWDTYADSDLLDDIEYRLTGYWLIG